MKLLALGAGIAFTLAYLVGALALALANQLTHTLGGLLR